jgi:hypothetical protein
VIIRDGTRSRREPGRGSPYIQAGPGRSSGSPAPPAAGRPVSDRSSDPELVDRHGQARARVALAQGKCPARVPFRAVGSGGRLARRGPARRARLNPAASWCKL